MLNRLVILLFWFTVVEYPAIDAIAETQSTSTPSPKARTTLANAAELGDWQAVLTGLSDGDQTHQPQADGMTALHWAVFHKNVEVINRLIGAKFDVNAVTRYRVTPLSIACNDGDQAVIERLLNAGGDIGTKMPGGETLLMIASRTGRPGAVEWLLKSGADPQATDRSGQSSLMWAAAEGNAEVIDVLVHAGADVNAALPSGFTAMMFAAREGRIEAVDRLLAAGVDVNDVTKSKRSGERTPRQGTSALLFAVESGHYELAMHLVTKGADANDQRSGFTPLHVVSWVRKPNSGDDPSGDPPPRGSGKMTDLQFVRAMVAAGADVNARLEEGDGGRAILTPRGGTPLLYASRTADLELMNVLVELGADPLAANVDGCTPIMAAAGVGVRAVNEEAGTEPEVLDAIDYLVGLGADVNSVDKNQETVMHGAAYRNFPLVVQRLAKHGADSSRWDHKNKSGWTPMMIAQGKRPGSFKPSPDTVAALQAAMTTH